MAEPPSGQQQKNQTLLSLAQGVAVAIGVFLILGAVLEKPFLDLNRRQLFFLIASGYGLAMTGLTIALLRGWGSKAIQMLLVAGGAVAPIVAANFATRPGFPLSTLLGGAAVVAVLALVALLIPGRHFLKFGVATVLAAAGVGLQAVLFREPPQQEGRLVTSLYNLEIASFPGRVGSSARQQGGITLFDDRYLLATGSGDLYVFQRTADKTDLEIQRLPYQVPLNTADFAAATEGRATQRWFRVAHPLAQKTANGVRLFVSHHHWNVEEECWTIRVSALEGTLDEFTSPSAPLAWSTVYETEPCVPLAAGPDEPPRFTGVENGGRLALLADNQLLVSVGDHEMDGWATQHAVSQDPASHYGKIMLVNLDDDSHEIYSLGFRNPQGLFVSQTGTVWSTEHGPAGGDELNVIQRGANYGWPVATYGTEYGTNLWPLTAKPGSHEGFAQPFYSWVPSVGTSVVIEIASPKFEHWQGDLLVGNLVGEALWRMRVRENRVVMAEQIPVGARIRDLLEGHDGELVMWTDTRELRFMEPGDEVATGEYLYRVCAGCHVASQVTPQSDTPAVGPALDGIVGREVASLSGFGYSAALRSFGGEWTRERLDAYIADPQATAPGTTMFFAGIKDAEARRVLIEYLADPRSRLDRIPIPF